MTITSLLNKITTAAADIPCCANFVKNHDNKVNGGDEPATKPKPPKTYHIPMKSKYSGKPSKYEDYRFDQLPVAQKTAVTALGYDKAAWDEKKWIEVDHKHWHDLTEEETTHVTTLGWDHDSWEHKYEHTDWADLPALVKEAATELGFTEHKWDHDEWPSTLECGWMELTDQQRLCLNVMGYSKEKWG